MDAQSNIENLPTMRWFQSKIKNASSAEAVMAYTTLEAMCLFLMVLLCVVYAVVMLLKDTGKWIVSQLTRAYPNNR